MTFPSNKTVLPYG